MKKVNISSFYNHASFMKDVKEGEKLLNVGMREAKVNRNRASNQFNVGDILTLTSYMFDGEILDIVDGDFLVQPISKKTGKKIKRDTMWINSVLYINGRA